LPSSEQLFLTQTSSFSSTSAAEVPASSRIKVRTVAPHEGRSGYPESRLLVGGEPASTDQLQCLKIRLVSSRTSARAARQAAPDVTKAQDQQRHQGPGDAAADKLDADAVKVFAKFVGCLTKDGKKSVAQVGACIRGSGKMMSCHCQHIQGMCFAWPETQPGLLAYGGRRLMLFACAP
jgi:hypothetical protein